MSKTDILILDFDETLIPVHLHNAFTRAINAASDGGKELTDKEPLDILLKYILKLDEEILERCHISARTHQYFPEKTADFTRLLYLFKESPDPVKKNETLVITSIVYSSMIIFLIAKSYKLIKWVNAFAKPITLMIF